VPPRVVRQRRFKQQMKTISPEYAAKNFSELIKAVNAGEEFLIADDHGPIARILPFGQDAEGTDEADAPSDEVEQAFYGD